MFQFLRYGRAVCSIDLFLKILKDAMRGANKGDKPDE